MIHLPFTLSTFQPGFELHRIHLKHLTQHLGHGTSLPHLPLQQLELVMLLPDGIQLPADPSLG